MKFNKMKAMLMILTVMVFAGQPVLGAANSPDTVKVTAKYGIVIADAKGKYTFRDLNDSTEKQPTIETTAGGTIMVPLEKLAGLIPGLTYQYDSAKKRAMVINNANGKKLTYISNKNYLYYYSGSKTKAVKKTIGYKTYFSEVSSAVMVSSESLKWLLKSKSGFQYYSAARMQTSGYDTSVYSGLILYNPYTAVSSIPLATKVSGISATVKATIPEGYSVAQTFNLLVKKGVCSSTKELYEAMANYDFSYYPLVSKIEDDTNRCFKLEGYLYPDTYEFYRLSKPQDIIGKILRNSETRITKEYRMKAEAMGYSMDQILTIASIIEKETGKKSIMPKIASVLYNRLNIRMKLQVDSTILYVERYIKPYISGDINRYNSFYNTYKCSALPAGPICNPGKAAIEAALNPETTDYLYFYSDDQGEYHFSVEYINPKATVTPTPDSSTDSDTLK